MNPAPRPVLRRLNAGKPGRSPWGTAMLAGLTGKHIARRAGLGAARRSARTSRGHCESEMDN
jgi:hypothetical protein